MQFTDLNTKQLFLEFATKMPTNFLTAIQPPATVNDHMKRKPIRAIINNVRAAYRTKHIRHGLEKTMPEKSLMDFKEHKPDPVTKARNIEFKIDENGFMFLFGSMDGVIPYFSKLNPLLSPTA